MDLFEIILGNEDARNKKQRRRRRCRCRLPRRALVMTIRRGARERKSKRIITKCFQRKLNWRDFKGFHLVNFWFSFGMKFFTNYWRCNQPPVCVYMSFLPFQFNFVIFLIRFKCLSPTILTHSHTTADPIRTRHLVSRLPFNKINTFRCGTIWRRLRCIYSSLPDVELYRVECPPKSPPHVLWNASNKSDSM